VSSFERRTTRVDRAGPWSIENFVGAAEARIRNDFESIL